MIFELSEQVKYRLTGLVVVVSIAAIFLPAMMKKQNHHYIENMNLSVKLPAKPVPPKVNIVNEKALFQSVKVAHVDIPKVVIKPNVSQLAIAEPLSIKSIVPVMPVITSKAPMLAKAKLIAKPVVVAKKESTVVPVVAKRVNAAAPTKVAKAVIVPKKGMYSVQLGSFVQQNNAKILVDRLRSKGYVASYNKFSGKQGAFYQVIVGQLHQKEEAKSLQKKLADSMRLNGFIVKQGVG